MNTPPILLTDLAERCEKLTGPCRETDILIGYAVDLKGDDQHLTFRRSLDVCGMEQMLRMAESHQNIWRHELPRYTASLDAAMTLVPEGWRFIDLVQTETGQWHAGLVKAGLEVGTDVGAATAALAVTFASFRARAASESPHG